MNPLPALRSFLRRWRWWGAGLAALIALYAIAGFLVLPMVLKSLIPERVGALLGRQVSLERVRTNPFTLSATLEGFQVKDADGSALLAWERLYVNAELWPLLRGRMGFKAIDLQRPRLRVALEKDGRLNFADILERFQEPANEPEPAAPSESMDLSIGKLRVAGAELNFVDRSLAEPFSSTLGPVSIELERFRTVRDARSPYAFRGRTEAGEGFAWNGTLGTDPLRSSGNFELTNLQLPKYAPYYQRQVAFDLQRGTASARASYEFEWSPGKHVMNVLEGSVSLDGLALAERGRSDPAVVLPSVQAAGIRADALASTIEIGSVTLSDGTIGLRRDKDGRLNLQTMLTPPPAPPETEPSEFKLNVRELAIRGFGLRMEDLVPERTVSLELSGIEGSLKDLNLDPGHASPLELSMRIGEKAALQATGSLSPLKTAGDLVLTLEGLDLPPLDPYLDTFADMRLGQGRLGLDGRLRFAFEGKKDDGLAYRGDVQISDFEAHDAERSEPFLRWKRLRLQGASIESVRPSVTLRSVEWSEPEGRMVIAQDGMSNVARALRLAPASGPVAAVVPPTPSEGPAPLVRIARMRIAGGRLSFIDRSLEPNAVLLLSEMEGSYAGLSTEAEEATMADFRGKAGGTAPILIQGKAMPLRHDKDTDVTIQINGADLTDFSPYTGKYLGYTTRQGKLDVDARVRIQERMLNIEDKVRLDRMYLGDKVDSPDATRLPVKLGLAILRDRRGVIELDVPIDGSLDDPDIHYGKMIWKAIFNVLGKIVTSPFTLLSKMFGGGEDLSSIVFPAGSSSIALDEQKKVDTLVKALSERPELSLEVEGTTDAEDLEHFKAGGLEALLKRAKWNARKTKVPASPEDEVIDPAERETWLRAAFDAVFPPPKDAKVEPPPLAEIEQKLLDTIQVDPGDLRELAEARNKASIEALLKDGQIEAGRIFEVQGSEAAKAGGAKVHFTLK